MSYVVLSIMSYVPCYINVKDEIITAEQYQVLVDQQQYHRVILVDMMLAWLLMGLWVPYLNQLIRQLMRDDQNQDDV
jgi:hypothetical protein